ncbi:magnesium transporter CorA family protein [Lactobacillus sp. LC28-10]|uniref:Magnesium transporter CorA family protein n=1 Tax=Secundilactobacillus angelensis TaxID=2722706 RepID=A0ABX1L0G0_9LACO|nr:magnesium transporter CorA family protein [Secundilactobacillus angelensis]MCH5462018.1 magnesium transporter CorA family protein [Secundilactobacillus angelensis]NLR18940.1 magnesium transporter CorA family protein [Secundilactobacillus angelensis]
MIEQHRLWQDLNWVSVDQPDTHDFNRLRDTYQIKKKYIGYMRDIRERARFDFDTETKCSLLIFRSVNQGEEGLDSGEYLETVPFCILIKGQDLITVTHPRNTYITDLLKEVIDDTKKDDKQPADTLMTIAFKLIFRLNENYLDRIDDMNKARESLETFQKRPSNKQITQLSNLDKRLVYLKTAANNNVIAIRQLQVLSDADDDPLTLSVSEVQHLKDLRVEVEQSREVANLAAEIADQVVSTYSNILDNSINNTMRLLTVWSLALAIPPIVSSFWGQNMPLPLAKEPWSWVFSIIISVIPIGLLLWYLKKHHDI